MQMLVGLATQNPANASVISGDSREWGLPLVPGVGSTYYTPQALQSDTFISQMSIGGGGSALALQNDGTAISWGNDDQGQLGDGSSGYHTASAPMLLPPVVQVSSGGNSWGVGLTSNGEVYTWGGTVKTNSVGLVDLLPIR